MLQRIDERLPGLTDADRFIGASSKHYLDIRAGLGRGEGRGDSGALQQPGQCRHNTEGTKNPTCVHPFMVA
ncbi:hypothetical protein MSEN_16860 [Mycolicibacter senuensis]|uniref:Uncharacterized protein n=1 Tax=Mycolicibacter senuensis TaxID=386913 RepID=A0A7I9XKJ9_9MYCO|nr:hypothetical protein MSEN_16860 [Mycolicibacter senuensis]